MQFNSVPFLFEFLPAFLLLYLLLPVSRRNGVLAAGSLLFYALGCRGRYWHLAALAALTAATYGLGLLLARGRKWLLGLSLGVLTALLVFCKVYQGGKFLPPGMSFYLFQMAAYLIDVSRQRIRPETRPVRYAAQITMFPKLLSGPLMKPAELQRQSWGRGYLRKDFHDGLQKLIAGLAMKVLLADRLSGLWNQAVIIGGESLSVPLAWMSLAGYSLRLYYDFFGYSLMAEGLGQMLGFRFPSNFRDPYASGSVGEFYRRWHATLGAWFRDYVYIPLGGSRKGTVRTVCNVCLVWLLTGLWHGIGASYLIWAAVICFWIVNEKLWLGRLLEKTRVFKHVYTVVVIVLSWLPFAVSGLGELKAYFLRLFGVGTALNPLDFLPMLRTYAPLLAAGIVLATPLPRKLFQKCRGSLWTDFLLLVLFWVTVYFLVTAPQDPFLYFSF